MFSDEVMKKLFGSERDEYGRDYRGVYTNELWDIEHSLNLAKDMFTENDLTVVVKYLLYECFSDSVNLDSEVCQKIAKQTKERVYE